MHKSGSNLASGAQEFVRFLEDHDYRHVFGLPGSSMVALLGPIAGSKVSYVPTIHESVTMAAADGYARVAGSGIALTYMLPGTANLMANLYNAWRDESPVIVLATQQISTIRSGEATIGEGDLVGLTKPFTRLSHEVTAGMPVYSWLSKARSRAGGPPSGPAFLAMTEDAMTGSAPADPLRASRRLGAGAPDISEPARVLREAKAPLLVVGGQVRRHGGTEALEELAARFEIPVAFESGFNDRMSIAPGHSHCIGPFRGRSRSYFEEADAVFVVGARFLHEAHRPATPTFPAAQFIAHVNADSAKLEEPYSADWSAPCDPASFLKALLAALESDPPSNECLAGRREWLASKAKAATAPAATAETETSRAMAAYASAAAHLHDALDHGWVVDEAVMASPMLMDALRSKDGRRFVGTSGASLGWGMGASAGIALASGEPVTCVIGDGSVRFGVHALWTIQALNLPITIVVLDNSGYGSTRYFEREYLREFGDGSGEKPTYFNMDMREMGPPVAQIIEGFGIPCTRVPLGESPRAAIEEAWRNTASGPRAVVIDIGFEG